MFFGQTAFATPTVVDSYSESNYSTVYEIKTSNSITKWGQAFSNTNSITLDSIKFYLCKHGSPTGNIYAKIYDIAGTYGTNAKPEEGSSPIATSDAVSASTLSLSSSLGLITFTFSGTNRITLSPSTNYAAVFEPEDLGNSNYTIIGVDITSPSHSGNVVRYFSPYWIGSNSTDTIFYVYGEEVTNTKLPHTFSSKTTKFSSKTTILK